MNYECILYETKDGVALITLNRPHRLNAWTPQMAAEVAHALARSNDDPEVGALVIAGAGRAFCAGADVIDTFKVAAEMRETDKPAPVRRPGGDLADLLEPLHYGKPVIAAMHGYAVGVGITLPVNCDFRIIAEGTKINTMFLRVGLVPEFGSSFMLPRLIGLAHALDIVLRPRMVEADEALAMGLVNKVVPADRLLDEALDLARSLARGPTGALRKAKELLYRNLDAELFQASKLEIQYFAECMATAEHREAIQAFMEKREPDFHKPQIRGRQA